MSPSGYQDHKSGFYRSWAGRELDKIAERPPKEVNRCSRTGKIESDQPTSSHWFSDVLSVFDYDFNIPSFSVVSGIEAEISGSEEIGSDGSLSTDLGMIALELKVPGDDSTETWETQPELPFPFVGQDWRLPNQTFHVGGPNFTWGKIVGPSQVNSPEFGASFRIGNLSSFGLDSKAFVCTFWLKIYWNVNSSLHEIVPNSQFGLGAGSPVYIIGSTFVDLTPYNPAATPMCWFVGISNITANLINNTAAMCLSPEASSFGSYSLRFSLDGISFTEETLFYEYLSPSTTTSTRTSTSSSSSITMTSTTSTTTSIPSTTSSTTTSSSSTTITSSTRTTTRSSTSLVSSTTTLSTSFTTTSSLSSSIQRSTTTQQGTNPAIDASPTVLNFLVPLLIAFFVFAILCICGIFVAYHIRSARKTEEDPEVEVVLPEVQEESIELPDMYKVGRTEIGNRYLICTKIYREEAKAICEATGLFIPFKPQKRSARFVLGSGMYGNIKIAFDKINGTYTAVKRVKGEKNINQSKEEALLHQKAGQCENVLPILHTLTREGADVMYHFMPLAGYGNGCHVKELMKNVTEHLRNKMLRLISHSLLDGMSGIHKLGIYHLDMKPENIVFTNDGNCFITDFGCAQESSNGWITNSIGDFRYFPPERFREDEEGYDGAKVDMYAIGLTILEMATGINPFHNSHTFDERKSWDLNYFRYIVSETVPELKQAPEAGSFFELIFGLLHPLPSERWGPEEAFNSLYFTKKVGVMTKPALKMLFAKLKEDSKVKRPLPKAPRRLRAETGFYNNENIASLKYNAKEHIGFYFNQTLKHNTTS